MLFNDQFVFGNCLFITGHCQNHSAVFLELFGVTEATVEHLAWFWNASEWNNADSVSVWLCSI